MSATTAPLTNQTAPSPTAAKAGDQLWLRSRKWDLIFISFSVIVVPLPYLVYLLLRSPQFAGLFIGAPFNIAPDEVDNFVRNMVNGFVAIAIGGPHMMSTYMRTYFDNNFQQRYPMLIRSALIIPLVVVSLAFLNLTLLLTVFFFWAAMHVLHQITYIVELYNRKEHQFVRRGSAISVPARMIDYAVILTCLFPMAAYKISQGSFDIGVNDLTRVIPGIFQQLWVFWVMSGVFLLAFIAYLVKTAREYTQGYLNVPKTVFILLTVVIAFSMPALPNLDTAFQGLNTWHSFQYLAITFYIIKVKQHYGDLDQTAPIIAKMSKGKDSRGLYLFSTGLLVGSLLMFFLVYALTGLVGVTDGNKRFDTAYYTAILAFLWIHYYHDHFLFTDFEVLDGVYAAETGGEKAKH
jgi:hypothetical protein